VTADRQIAANGMSEALAPSVHFCPPEGRSPEGTTPETTAPETPTGAYQETNSCFFDESDIGFIEEANGVAFESASRGRLSAEKSGLAAGQEERPVQRASDFATDDGNVVITHEQFTEWDQRYPAVSNKRGRVRHASRSWLSEQRDQSQFEARFETYLRNEDRKAAAKKPKQTAAEKQAAEQARRERERRNAAAAEFQKWQDAKIRARRAGLEFNEPKPTPLTLTNPASRMAPAPT
jgi:hypothetical protein